LNELPLTSNGKLDLQGLPAPAEAAYAQRSYEAPLGEIEQALAQLWSELLEVPRIGRHDNFFELGGHSLAVTRLGFLINERFGVTLGIRQIYEQQSLEQLAAALSRKLTKRTKQTLVLEL
jgi:acyl carrier protein